MAVDELTGSTAREIEEERQAFYDRILTDKTFEEEFCLHEIPNQPDHYDGPTRFCMSRSVEETANGYRCKFHSGAPENLDPTANMSHGMTATREHLVEDFDDKDQALYDWIYNSFSEAYDIDVEEDPSSAHDLHVIAAEIVRAERGRGFLIEEGEVNETERISEDGSLVTDAEGNVKTEKSEHYLAKMIDRQDKKINRLKKELGVTRKERLGRDQTDDAVNAVKGFAELGAAFLDRDEQDYDPESEPWKGEEDDDG